MQIPLQTPVRLRRIEKADSLFQHTPIAGGGGLRRGLSLTSTAFSFPDSLNCLVAVPTHLFPRPWSPRWSAERTMEALGVAASIIAVVQISVQVINTCTKFIEALGDAPKDLRLILIEVSALRGLFEPLKVLVGFDNDMAGLKTQLKAPVEGCLEAVRELDALISVADSSDDARGDDDADGDASIPRRKRRRKFASLLVRLAWPLKEDRAKRLLNLIGVYKNTINLLLSSHGV